MQNLKEIRCQCCNKLLAKVGTVKHLEIKCSRCKTIKLDLSVGVSRTPERHR